MEGKEGGRKEKRKKERREGGRKEGKEVWREKDSRQILMFSPRFLFPS